MGMLPGGVSTLSGTEDLSLGSDVRLGGLDILNAPPQLATQRRFLEGDLLAMRLPPRLWETGARSEGYCNVHGNARNPPTALESTRGALRRRARGGR